MTRGWAVSLTWCAALAWWPVAGAADATTDAMLAAYAPYREALFRTNTGDAAGSKRAIEAAVLGWREVSGRFAKAPAPPYDRDTGFARTLDEVQSTLASAAAQVDAQGPKAAHETLERVRDLLSDLRRRNGVVVYSDHMNAYHEVMEAVLHDGAGLTADGRPMAAMIARVGVLEWLAARLRSEAAPSMRADGGFDAALQAVERSVAALRDALHAGDAAGARAAIGALKAPYSRLFLRWG